MKKHNKWLEKAIEERGAQLITLRKEASNKEMDLSNQLTDANAKGEEFSYFAFNHYFY
jgi:hypothetical protein